MPSLATRGELRAALMAHSFDASMPTPSPGSSRPSAGPRYRRDQFPPAPKSVRIVTLSNYGGDPVGVAAGGNITKQGRDGVRAQREKAIGLIVFALCVIAVLGFVVFRTVWK